MPLACDYADCAAFEPACDENYSDDARTGADIDTIVIHTVEGSYDDCIDWFGDCSASVSAHYVVRSHDGQVTQMVAERDIAWHAGDWDTNVWSIGIEHEGYVDDPEGSYTDAMYRASAALVLDIALRNGVPLDRDHIIGHSEVPGCPTGDGGGVNCHHDPGDGWDWDFYMALLTGETPDPEDTGELFEDTGETPEDTGTPEDTSEPVADTGEPPPDTGGMPPEVRQQSGASGCGCGHTSPSGLPWFFATILFMRSRRSPGTTRAEVRDARFSSSGSGSLRRQGRRFGR